MGSTLDLDRWASGASLACGRPAVEEDLLEATTEVVEEADGAGLTKEDIVLEAKLEIR